MSRENWVTGSEIMSETSRPRAAGGINAANPYPAQVMIKLVGDPLYFSGGNGWRLWVNLSAQAGKPNYLCGSPSKKKKLCGSKGVWIRNYVRMHLMDYSMQILTKLWVCCYLEIVISIRRLIELYVTTDTVSTNRDYPVALFYRSIY